MQKPLWCLVVRHPYVIPADFAALAQLRQSSLPGLNSSGEASGSGQSSFTKVGMLKWMNIPKRKSTNLRWSSSKDLPETGAETEINTQVNKKIDDNRNFFIWPEFFEYFHKYMQFIYKLYYIWINTL
jgi:hypothetical protein